METCYRFLFLTFPVTSNLITTGLCNLVLNMIQSVTFTEDAKSMADISSDSYIVQT